LMDNVGVSGTQARLQTPRLCAATAAAPSGTPARLKACRRAAADVLPCERFSPGLLTD
jgi:hypothetical protein